MTMPIERPLTEFHSVVPDFIDVFMCCASFEARCLSIAQQIEPDSVGVAIVAENEDVEAVGKHAAELHARYGAKAKRVAIRSDNPLYTADQLSAGLTDVQGRGDGLFVVDVSTFTHEHLLQLLALLRSKRRGRSVIIVYTGAAEYMLGEDKWLSHGIGEVRSVLGYPGVLPPSRSLHLVVLVGFELERAHRLVDVYAPEVVSLGYATEGESLSRQHFERNVQFHRDLSGRLANVHEFTFSCRDVVATERAIAQQVAKFPGHSAVVAPLNTKVSTIGAAMAAFADPSIQLCYAAADRYNYKGYSSPGDTFYVVNVPPIWGTE